jgi:hypothetical protein
MTYPHDDSPDVALARAEEDLVHFDWDSDSYQCSIKKNWSVVRVTMDVKEVTCSECLGKLATIVRDWMSVT